ncbi:hypothetical protein AVEN_140146-1 [Araneus ventricosus]|uniref:Uncharacterized protein n=1 Tax=Araneus ventricosus TaxID=182803 RepID=A0A4Y2G021_ARAVE|nr:hypothetical protein AVEN_140146-1 [Araneus ventricosus]
MRSLNICLRFITAAVAVAFDAIYLLIHYISRSRCLSYVTEISWHIAAMLTKLFRNLLFHQRYHPDHKECLSRDLQFKLAACWQINAPPYTSTAVLISSQI